MAASTCLAALLGLVAAGARGQAPDAFSAPGDVPLTGYGGPYRGRVVELLTDRPLADALIVLLWDRAGGPGEDGRVSVAAREAVTDAGGGFVLDAPDVEAAPPAGAWAPRLILYKAGYVSLPRELEPGLGVPVAWLRERGGILALKPARDAEEQFTAFNVCFALTSVRQEFRARFGAPGSSTHWHRIMRAALQRFIDESKQAPDATGPKR
jgi:hypothetical protein